ncbi:hypothetical protein [Marinoscillum sp.]|uniref:hypothetical protein n=1 Tax=Marinoscillum sp. TaxID=2024838 RepID=UPI003BAB4435
MEVTFYQAECGDAARIHFKGTDNKSHNVFIDSGFKRTFRSVLFNEIKEIQKNSESIGSWIISHIHEDHIGGILAYLKSVENGEQNNLIESAFYNSARGFASSNNTSIWSGAASIKQGEQLESYLIGSNIHWHDNVVNTWNDVELFGLKIIFLSPSQNQLNSLREKYGNISTPYERIEGETISSTVSTNQSDYHIPIDDFDLQKWEEDSSVENASSISFISEYQNRRILWLADSIPSEIINSLRKKGYSPANPLICEWVKLSHHGSVGNNSVELFEMIYCKKYLISANGENKHLLPNKECLVRVLKHENRNITDHIELHFTYDNPTLRNIFRVDGKDIYDKLNFSTHFMTDNTPFIVKE